MRRRNVIPGKVLPRTHECKPPFYFWRGPTLGTLWHCDCGRWWVWAYGYPGSLSGDYRGRAHWQNTAFGEVWRTTSWDGKPPVRFPDARDHGGYGRTALPLFGSPADGMSLPDDWKPPDD